MLKILRRISLLKVLFCIILISLILTTGSCYYLKATRSSGPPLDEIQRLQAENKFFILHLGDKTWHLTDITISEGKLSGTVSSLLGHQMYKKVTTDEPVRYRKSKVYYESEALHEVHVYATSMERTDNVKVIIPNEAIRKIEVYDKAVGTTVASWVLSGTGMAATAWGGVMLVALATSCPFVFINEGENYTLAGEIFSGAVQPGLERDDYLPLPGITPTGNAYCVKLTNLISEVQFVNLAELIIIDHPSDMTVLADKYGKLFYVCDPIPPVGAYSRDNTSILPLIVHKDSLSYLGNESQASGNSIEEIILQFRKPEGAESAKLIIRAKNSIWLDGLISEIHRLFGERYNAYSIKQEKASGDKLRKWALDQKMPLSVYIEKNNRWEFVDCFNIAGPIALKDDILSLDLGGISSDTIKIKLETGFLFWELDYAGVDFSNNIPVHNITSLITSAIDNTNSDVKSQMLKSDSEYYILDEKGDEALLVFDNPEQKEICRTIYLHSRGYYKIKREQSGEPDKKKLRTFLKPGSVPEFSREVFDALMNN